MGINVEGYGGAGMAKLGLDVFNILPRFDQKTGAGVAEVMNQTLINRLSIST